MARTMDAVEAKQNRLRRDCARYLGGHLKNVVTIKFNLLGNNPPQSNFDLLLSNEEASMTASIIHPA